MSDQSIVQFLDTAEAISKIRDPLFRSDVAGSFQALVGLWQILVRQRTIPEDKADAAFSGIVTAFAHGEDRIASCSTPAATGVKTLFGGNDSSERANQRMLDLLAGADRSDDVETRDAMEQDSCRILDAQRIISLDTLFELADHIDSESGKARSRR